MSRLLVATLALVLFGTASYAETQCLRDSMGNFTCTDKSPRAESELEKVYGSWNPQTYLEGSKQLEQAVRIREEQIKQSQLQNQGAALANQYEAQNNALRIENQRLKNEALARENNDKRLRYGTDGVALNDEQYKRLQTIGDEELSQMIKDGQRLTATSDPANQAKGSRLLQIARLGLELRQKR
jgi:hypothetical protein